MEPTALASVTLQHRWADRMPRVLYGKHLRVCYRLLADGVVTRQLVGVDDPSGTPFPRAQRVFRWFNWTEEQERGGRDGTGRPVVLVADAEGRLTSHDDAEAALLSWLESVGLIDPEEES
jgi:hypothetical protein